jgi:hypothetical protein
MKRLLARCVKPILVCIPVLVLVAAGFAIEHYGFGTYETESDSLSALIEWSAERAGTDVEDTRLYDALLRTRTLIGQIEPRVFKIFGESLLWKPHSLGQLRFGDPPEESDVWLSTYDADKRRSEHDAAVELMRRIEASGYDESVEHAMALPKFVLAVDPRDGVPMLDLTPLRVVTVLKSIERLRCHVAIEDGDDADLIRSFERLLWLESLARHVPGEFSDGVANVIVEEAILAAVEYSMYGSTREQTLVRLSQRLSSLQPDHLERVLEQERLLGRALMEGVLAKDGAIAGGSPRRQFATLDRVVGEMRGMFTLPMHERRQAYTDVLERIPHDGWAYFRNKSAYTVTPILGVSLIQVPKLHVKLVMVRLLLAVETHRIRHGRLPASIGEIDAELLPERLGDVFRPGHDVVYRVFDEPDQFGRAYVIYSAGYNLQDDGGIYNYTPIDRGKQWKTDLMINPPPWDRSLPADVFLMDGSEDK